MLSDLTPEEFAYCSACLALAQALGLEQPPGEISYQALAEWYDLTTVYEGDDYQSPAKSVAKPVTRPDHIATAEASALEKLRNILHV